MSSSGTLVFYEALADNLLEPSRARLESALGAPVELRSWRDGPPDGAILLLAPHELSESERERALGGAAWLWVHLTSAGADFVDLGRWSHDALLTRSWNCYAAPLTEYAVHAVLTHEWRTAAPWQERDMRPPAGADTPPAPAAAGGGGATHRTGLWGAKVGIAGWGAVGQQLAAAFGSLGAAVTVLRRAPEELPGSPVRQTSVIDEVLDCDHLVLALPLTPQTTGLFDRAALRRARPGLHLVNVSRAALIDQDALAELCAAGRLFATLDVTAPEPLPPDHPLRHLPSVRLSPHVAWRSRGSDGAFLDDFTAVWRALGLPDGDVPGRVPPTRAAAARAAVRATLTPTGPPSAGSSQPGPLPPAHAFADRRQPHALADSLNRTALPSSRTPTTGGT
ncbi:hypothetical protein J7E88_09635 [Streptomyces sp. ISL-10]|uniref:NAD(P)-dependent oxidoreductase n=1 Tax=Streptomyces sp. ISL-10 TaxID=2819172 RepID=UPI001BEC6D49|nr:NAD(P)-dependent oxidoreductase [Streptomyces sp. ISL-10]MBT2365572.1 hypothetical protein [Streptomyces sp. ISL-10]